MKILIVDGHGGQLGAQIVKSIKNEFTGIEIIAVGTNSAASLSMLKAGADNAATGENPVIVACRSADIIIGPVGIVIADSLYGEITPAMSAAVGQADATRILIPMNKCENIVAGVRDLSTSALIDDVIDKLKNIIP